MCYIQVIAGFYNGTRKNYTNSRDTPHHVKETTTYTPLERKPEKNATSQKVAIRPTQEDKDQGYITTYIT
jgi:hypothetical protein